MTSVAQNQLEFHKQTYFPACQKTYADIMKCYEDPRQTNEETDACAEKHRQRMSHLQNELGSRLRQKCKWLEQCTDTCKTETNMPCINSCGTKFVKDLHKEFDQIISKF